MSELDDSEFTDLLGQLRYTAPELNSLWEPTPRTQPRSRRMWLVGMVAAIILVASGTVVAATNNWFAAFVPSNACVTNDPSCGADFHQVGIIVDHESDIVAVNVLVKPGLTRERLRAIAVGVAAQQRARRVIVYVLDDLPPGPMIAGFPELPADVAVSPPPPLAALVPYLRLTYDSGPGGAVSIWP